MQKQLWAQDHFWNLQWNIMLSKMVASNEVWGISVTNGTSRLNGILPSRLDADHGMRRWRRWFPTSGGIQKRLDVKGKELKKSLNNG